MKFKIAYIAFAIAILIGFSALFELIRGSSNQTPKLVLFIVIDQGAYDTITRIQPLLSGGLKKLLDNGVQFSQAFHDHALPSTCPGHAALSSGYHPSHSGIIDNEWYDTKEEHQEYCVHDSKFGISPSLLQVQTIGDILKQRLPGTRVFSVSGKDRAAVMLGGHHPDGAYWFDGESGHFTSSSYYPHFDKKDASLLTSVNAQKYFGHLWEQTPVDLSFLAQQGFHDLNTPILNRRFPHLLGNLSTFPDKEFLNDFIASPFLDELTAQFAENLIKHNGIGTGKNLDMLFISFSSVDTVGHPYGPNSREVADTLLRLDQSLGHILEIIDAQVGLKNSLVILSADHGVLPFPENGKGHRSTIEEALCIQQLGQTLNKEFGQGSWIKSEGYINRALSKEKGVDPQQILTRIKNILSGCSIVNRVVLQSELSTDPSNVLYEHSFYSGRSPDYYIERKEYSDALVDGGTNHNTKWNYDRHVPLLFAFFKLKPQIISTPVTTVDVAPTLADMLGIPFGAADGKSRISFLKQSAD